MLPNEPRDVHSAEEAPDMVPLDGRDGQPVEQGGQDDPRTLDANDPLKDPHVVVDDDTQL
ncbi:hypothetical protein [Jonesia denitrificans]|uniref:Uncharacterized protein n=1 Tax=Jonesia denitrificans (strain ATCC 14870 / DSM 20603 / BCRC 15368 / CIP 55.134 / JCM 11481 / NBRC 15587 / NCTC 10816 / Prevot 55134) TaxID=471856 RepID=C7R2T9_JONDD|nr:hypothetical protein [Jonesia denitrificans]ACV08561.1 hypothetical protein Jden_0900 [Jonesia denitrificans DSM 20603]ASE07813.1 hypothetical protein CEP80_00640 [Jonesia denitrificans]QXB42423.1 hypothetical protein I6L70_07515 [Jonesia denitrificans]SQH20546.1 Uncharacterised protein [Jonesia denitrificans]